MFILCVFVNFQSIFFCFFVLFDLKVLDVECNCGEGFLQWVDAGAKTLLGT